MPEGGKSNEIFVSSDLVTTNAKGDIEITGRVSNMINVDGVKISAEQIEGFLVSQPGILQAAVIRLALKDGRERPLAFIASEKRDSLHSSQDKILDACASKLGAKARPHSLVLVDHIPVNSSGKVDRIEVSRLYKDLLSKMAET
jgi:acyl-coenzyme A synthetase/AMP-(fatty) acid ligase